MSYEIEPLLEKLKAEGLFRELTQARGLSFSHNDYLALSRAPELVESAKSALEICGAGSKGSRLLGGHSSLFEETESRIAEFFGSPAALFFSSGYLANLAAVTTAAKLVEEVWSDELIHASLIDGVRLSGISKQIVPHQQWQSVATNKKALLIAEALYSMDGDFVDDTLMDAQRRNNAFLLIDEAHSCGVFRESGQGYWQYNQWDTTIKTVTFGKAFGVAGAAILCSKAFRELLISSARSFIYTTAPSPVVVAMVKTAIDLIEKEPWRREALWELAERARDILQALVPVSAGSPWARRSPILPIRVPGADVVMRVSHALLREGIEVRGIRYPTVKKGEERLRISLNLHHSSDNTLYAMERIRDLVQSGK